MAKREYQWFIQALNKKDNDSVAWELPAENFFEEVPCSDGKRRDMFLCENREQAKYFFKSLGRENVTVYSRTINQANRYGKARPVNLLMR